jgi:hypothetical protein
MLFVLGILLKRVIPLALLAVIVLGGIWAWREANASVAASLPDALGTVRAADLGEGRSDLPLAGVYRYTASGDERLGVGPLEITRKLPDEALLVVLPEAKGVRSLEWRYSRDSGERWRVVAANRGTNVVFRSATVGVRGFSRDFGGATVPALWRPKSPRPGLRWSATYRAGDALAFRRDSTVVRQETITIGDQKVRAWRIDSKERVTGSVDGDLIERVWWSPELDLDVKRTITSDIGGTVSHHLQATLTLQSIAPER